jgi:hypothetical protein
MSPTVSKMFELIANQAREALRVCSNAGSDPKENILSKNDANHLIGIASYIDVMAREIKAEIDKERS